MGTADPSVVTCPACSLAGRLGYRRADGRRGLCLSVRLDNPALRLYERLGFAPIPDSELANRAGGRSLGMGLRF